MKNFGKSSRVHSQGVQKIFMAPIYGAHCAVIFATAQLSCYNARPQKFDGQKIAQNFSQFLTTFDFDREYLWNESIYQKSEKLLIIYNPSHVRPKKSGILWSINKKVIDRNKCSPNGIFFRETISRPLGGAAP